MTNYDKYKKFFPELSPETLNQMPEELILEIIETNRSENNNANTDNAINTDVNANADIEKTNIENNINANIKESNNAINTDNNKEVNAEEIFNRRKKTSKTNTTKEVTNKESELTIEDNKQEVKTEKFINNDNNDIITTDNNIDNSNVNDNDLDDVFDPNTGEIKINNNIPMAFVENNYNKYINDNLMSTYHIILPISGYSASVRGMTIAEQDYLKNSAESETELLERLRRTIYNCIQQSSIKMTYDQFLANTESSEVSILLFGIMIKTFGKLKNFEYVCNKCESKNSITNFPIEDFVTIHSDEVKAIFQNIETNPEEAFSNSKLKIYKKRIRLNDSKLVVELGFNSLYKDTKLERLFNKEEKELSLYTVMTILNALYIPIFDENNKNRIVSYAEVKAPRQMFNFLMKITKNDKDEIIKTVEEELKKYRITYETEQVCSNCGNRQQIEFSPIENFFLALFLE